MSEILNLALIRQKFKVLIEFCQTYDIDPEITPKRKNVKNTDLLANNFHIVTPPKCPNSALF